MKRIIHLEVALAGLTFLGAASLAAQSTKGGSDQQSSGQAAAGQSSSGQSLSGQSLSGQSSLGDYARKVHKDSGTKSKPKVFDNDNLPKDDKLSVVGEPDPEGPGTGNSTDSSKSTSPSEGNDASSDKGPAGSPNEEQAKKQAEWKSWQEKLEGQKSAIDLASRELEVLQKEYQLRAAAMYADVGNRLRNQTQWDKQDADYKQQIADKQKAVDDAKQKLEDMQEEARKAGVPAAMREP
jgi:hypothetical protein